ncbi:MAG: serine hydrolase [Nitrospiraceae bacterium]|nr:serine hydrolase [Nitrospiraceae bacterium]
MMSADPIDLRMDRAVTDGVFPGGVLLVEFKGETVHHAAYGFASCVPTQLPTTITTIYDLASLTKPLATTLAVMLLVQDQALILDRPICQYLPQLNNMGVGQATPRHLLSHSAGFPAWKSYYLEWDKEKLSTTSQVDWLENRQRIYDRIHREKLEYPIGAGTTYSDLGFILLTELVETISRKNFGEFCLSRIFNPLATVNTFFVAPTGPVCSLPAKDRVYAATEDDQWRGRVLFGEVHDENAYVLGGIAGHAGLFSTASDVLNIVREYGAAVRGEGRILRADLARLCITRQKQVLDSTRALGWDTPSDVSSSGRYFSDQSFGHLGFTGTSIWVDPIMDLIVVLLTNRVHPSRANERIREFRPLLHDLIYEWCAKL